VADVTEKLQVDENQELKWV